MDSDELKKVMLENSRAHACLAIPLETKVRGTWPVSALDWHKKVRGDHEIVQTTLYNDRNFSFNDGLLTGMYSVWQD